MTINGVDTRAELLDARKAADIYQRIVRSMKDPALLEYLGSDLFRARVFPIEARSEKRIRLTYREIVAVSDGTGHYRYPLKGSRFETGRFGVFAMSITVQTTDPLKIASSPTHPFETVRVSDREVRLSLETEKQRPDRDIEVFFSSDRKAIGLNLVTHLDGGDRARTPGEPGAVPTPLGSPGRPPGQRPRGRAGACRRP